MERYPEDVTVKVSTCENMEEGRVIILCSPKTKDTVDNMLTIVQDSIEANEQDEEYDGDNFPFGFKGQEDDK